MAQSPGSCEDSSFAEAVVPADAYRQVRLRLVPNQPAANDPVPEENACQSIGFNCIVTADGGILLLDGEAPEIQIQSGRIAGGFLRILAETDVTVAIEFNPYSSLARLAGEAVRLVPVFIVDSQAACASLANSDR